MLATYLIMLVVGNKYRMKIEIISFECYIIILCKPNLIYYDKILILTIIHCFILEINYHIFERV